MKSFPTVSSGVIPGDPHGRTYAELDHWYKQQGTSLYQQCVALLGDPVSTKKKLLLKLAQDGAKRPSARTEIGSHLTRYTAQKSLSYDPNFNTVIRALRPDWFENPADVKKRSILELARSGGPRPSTKDAATQRWGIALGAYTRRKSKCYDPKFDAEIRKLRPDWFSRTHKVSSSPTQKAALLKLAKKSSARKPTTHHSSNVSEKRLARALARHTNNNSSSYDQDFDEEIRKLQPEWFDSVVRRKTTLIELAKNGAKRPSSTSGDRVVRCLGALLSYYTTTGSVRHVAFNNEIRQLRPDWFAFADRPHAKKAKLCRMAKAGTRRPNSRAKDVSEKRLGMALTSYTTKSSKAYDRFFAEVVQRLRPDWFSRHQEGF